MLKNIDSLVQKFTEQVHSDPDRVNGEWIQLIYNSLDIENLDIHTFHYIWDTLGENQFISLIEIQTDDIGYEYDELIDNQSLKDVDDDLEKKFYHQAIKKVLKLEIDSI